MARLLVLRSSKSLRPGSAVAIILSTLFLLTRCKADPESDEPNRTTGGTGGAQGGKSATGGKNSGGLGNRGGSGGSAAMAANGGDGEAGGNGEAGSNGEAGGDGGSATGGNGGSAGASGGSDSSGGVGATGPGGEGGQGASGEPQILVPFPMIGGTFPKIGVDDDYVYWMGAWVGENPPTPLPPPSGSYLLRVPKGGGAVTVLFDATNVPGVDHALAVGTTFAMDATYVYVATSLDVLDNLIFKVPKDGSAATILAQPRGGIGGKSYFALADGKLYFEHYGGGIDSVSVDGGPIVPVIDRDTTPYPDGFDYFPGESGLVSDGINVYYCGNDEGMFKVAVGGGQPALLFPRNVDGARFSGSASWPAVAGGSLYWNYYGYIYKVSVDGGPLTTVVEPTDLERSFSGPETVIDGDYVYYIDRGVQKAALDGSSRTRVLTGEAGYNVSHMAIDESSVYLVAYSGQGIIKVPK